MTAAPTTVERARPADRLQQLARTLRDPWVVAIIAALVVLAVWSGDAHRLPVRLPLAREADELHGWVITNRGAHPLFVYGFGLITEMISGLVSDTDAILGLLGWPGVLLLAGVLAWRVADERVAVVAVGVLLVIGLLGVWDEAMRTLAQMIAAVTIALALGIPLGIVAGRRAGFASAIRPVLDTMQIIPAYVYLLPLVVLFGIGDPAGIVATVIYALPPAVRLTALGIRSVPQEAYEVGDSVGASSRQLLRTIQLPQAMPSIRVGINQTIMMALAMVVIASLIGATGLGREVLRGLQTLDVGRAFVAGIAIVLLAVLLDRITWAAGQRRRTRRLSGRASAGLVIGAAVVGFVLGRTPLAATVPGEAVLALGDRVNALLSVVLNGLRPVTLPISDALTTWVMRPVVTGILSVPWWVAAAVIAVIAWRTLSARFAAYTVAAAAVIAAIGAWANTMNTFSQVAIAAVLTLALAFPLGLAAALSDRVESGLRPVLDTMQTMPAFVYLIPVVFLFGVGRVPGIIATIVYAMPPAIRLTSNGIRSVPSETVEAARSQGATTWQLLRTVQLPLAKPSILLGVNQTTMMVLASIIIAGLVGAGGLGVEAVFSLQQAEVGRGIEAGLAIVLFGIVLDRVTQSLGAAEDERTRARMRTG